MAKEALKDAAKHITKYSKGSGLDEMRTANTHTRSVQSHLAQARFQAELERKRDKTN